MSNTDIQDKPEGVIEPTEAVPSPETTDNEEPVRSPLSVEDFRSVIQQISDLGLTWTADIPPRLRSKDLRSQDQSFPAREISEVQHKYPDLPRELGNVIFYALTGSDVMRSMIGADDAEQKAQIARELVISQRRDFSGEFFFKYAIKVPYFVDLDWEVVVKAYERNVREMPLIPYALLSLIIRQSMSTRYLIGADSEAGESETLTVAVDGHLIEKLIRSLTEARAALERAGELAKSLSETAVKTETEQ